MGRTVNTQRRGTMHKTGGNISTKFTRTNIQIIFEDLTEIIQKTYNIHHIQNINQIILNRYMFPEFLIGGKTYIKPKSNETQITTNYRLITYLPTLYKILASVIIYKIEQHFTGKETMLNEEQGQQGTTNNTQFYHEASKRKTGLARYYNYIK